MSRKDTELVEFILQALNLKGREELRQWVDDFSTGYECDHYWGFTYEDDTYRLETEADREARRAARREQLRRYESGEMTGYERLMYATIQRYVLPLETAIFNSSPLMFQLTNHDESEGA